MKFKILGLMTLLFIAGACGKDSPFDSDYWDDPDSDRRSEEVSDEQSYKVDIVSLSPQNLGNISGSVIINVDATDVTTSTELSDLPQSLMIGQRSITTTSCADLALAYPAPLLTDTEFKSVSVTDTGTRVALSQEVGSGSLNGLYYVVKAYVQTVNSPAPQSAGLIPVACGLIELNGGDSVPSGGGTTGTDGSSTGGMVGGSIGGTGGTTGVDSSSNGGVAGGTTGSGGSTTGGVVGGSIGGTSGAEVGF